MARRMGANVLDEVERAEHLTLLMSASTYIGSTRSSELASSVGSDVGVVVVVVTLALGLISSGAAAS